MDLSQASGLLALGAAVVTSGAALAGYWFLVAGRRVFASATNIFLVFKVLFLVGTVVYADFSRPDDRLWVFVVAGGTVCFIVGTLVANLWSGFRPREEIGDFTSAPVRFDIKSSVYLGPVLGLGAVAVAVGVAFAVSVGYNVLIWAARQYLTTGSVDRLEYTILRTDISRAVEGYVAPGYALQFTGVILPIVIAILYFRVRETNRRAEMVLLAAFAAADLYFLTIMGGRGWLVHAVLAFALLVSPWGPVPAAWRRIRRVVVAVMAALAGFYIVTTFFMGRLQGESGSLESTVVAAGGDLANRVIGVAAPYIEIMRVLLHQPVVWGREWLSTLVSILPGAPKGFGFGNELHALVFSGNTWGTMALPVWGSFWYNWGVAGTLLLAVLTGFLVQEFTIWYVRGDRSLTRIVILFVAGYRLGLLRDPYSLLLDGFFTAMAYYFLVRVVEGRVVRLGIPPRRPVAETVPGDRNG